MGDHHHHMHHHMHAYYHCGYPFEPEVDDEEEQKKKELRGRRGDDADDPVWKAGWAEHKKRVKEASAVVDCRPPIVNRHPFTRPDKLNCQIARFVQIEKENTVMLKKIEHVMKDSPQSSNQAMSTLYNNNVRDQMRQCRLYEIACENIELVERIQKVKPMYSRKELAKQYRQNEKQMAEMSYYPLWWRHHHLTTLFERMRKQAMELWAEKPRCNVYLNLESREGKVGVVVIELRTDVCPMTCFNFYNLCTGDFHSLSYKCSQINRIIPGILWQGGDVIGKDGRGGRSIYGEVFPDENFILKHDEPGVISMANIGPNTNGSQFIISNIPLPPLDEKNVVFGKVFAGLDILLAMNEKYASRSGALQQTVWIQSCGDATSDKEAERKRLEEADRKAGRVTPKEPISEFEENKGLVEQGGPVAPPGTAESGTEASSASDMGLTKK